MKEKKRKIIVDTSHWIIATKKKDRYYFMGGG